MMVSHTILEKVKEFLIRLVRDSGFSTKLETSPIDQVQILLQEAGYTFSQADFETAAIQILDLKEHNEFHELTETELVGAVGGWIRRFPYPYPSYPIIQPMYGVIVEPPENGYPKPRPLPLPQPLPQPMYGVIIEPPDVQPMYGVIVSPEIY